MNVQVKGIPGPEITANGRKYLYFGGTSYLGLQHAPRFRELYASNTMAYGTHWGASRSGNVTLALYGEAETALAAKAGAGGALTLSSGFLAGRLLTDRFSAPAYRCFFAPTSHAALLPPGAGRAADWPSLVQAVTRHLESGAPQTPVIFTDSLDFSEGPRMVVSELASLPSGQCILVVDDSHGLGLIGENGWGTYPAFAEVGFREVILCGSMGKALGITAGLILGPASRISDIKQEPLFSGASPPPPAALATYLQAEAEGLLTGQRGRLDGHCTTLASREGLPPSLKWMPGYPVFTFRNPGLVDFLEKAGILVTHFDYTADGPAASPSRIVLSAAHTTEHMERLAEVLTEFQKIQS
ncbi:aminotransferase class I/II-fold pyridoxal phosphate-dependent enzyme [Robiginitalea sediminis]|uniref:aminotransferase class I/II-fold pyridoxal phosphate-dependent enzyme n=1 Tax=Robiginitalea sediminis TaxID=1982593 RepID=UPI000B4AB4FE|nr:aminotransferase class I/II-fold pyridoxal phosphate-dependent enzyme [Robiginitalea sediminis]